MISTFADTPEVDVIYKIIFSFHMPAFIFVSGYFAKVEPKKILSRIFPLYIVFQSGQYHVGTSGKNRYAVFYTALDIMVSDGNDHLSAFAAGIRHKKQAASGGLSAFIDGAWHSDRL